MGSPSRFQMNNDVVTKGVLSSHSSNSSASDQSDVLPAPVQLEGEVALEIFNRDLPTKEEDDRLNRPTISYEEALEREQEYQRRIKTMLFQHCPAADLVHKPFQKPPPKPSLLGFKRKAGDLAEIIRVSSTLPDHLQEWGLPPRPPHQMPSYPIPINQIQGFVRPLKRQSPGQKKLKQKQDVPKPRHHCNLCMVDCTNFEHLTRHYQGKKHKAKWYKTQGK